MLNGSVMECSGPWSSSGEYEKFARSNCTGYLNPCTMECAKLADGYRQLNFENTWVRPYADYIYGCVYPGLVVLTILANIFVVLVLTKKHMRTPTNTVLLYMAIADLCVALVPFPFLTIYFIFNFEDHMEHIEPWWCYMAHFSAVEALPVLCHNAAMWLTVVLAAQRLIYVRIPLRASQVCTIRNVNIATMVIVCMAIVGAFPKFIDVEHYTVLNYRLYSSATTTMNLNNRSLTTALMKRNINNTTINKNVTISTMFNQQPIAIQPETQPTDEFPPPIHAIHTCIYRYSSVVRGVKENVYYSGYYWTRVVVFVMIPSLLLIILSILLINSIQRARLRRSRLTASHPTTAARQQNGGGQNGTAGGEQNGHANPSSGTATPITGGSERLRVPPTTSRGAHQHSHQTRDHTTMMLVMIVFVFLVVNLPQGLILALFCIQQTFSVPAFMHRDYVAVAMMVDNMLILATYPLNFAIYCSMSTAFRDTFRTLFCHRVHIDIRRNSLYSTYSNSTRVNGVNSIKQQWVHSETTITTPLMNATRV